MQGISGTTRVIAILGDPVSHSRSPAMHGAAFEALGLDFVYVALRVAASDLARAIRGVRALGFAGLNLTVPHKERILPLLDSVTPRARQIGAVNTVVASREGLAGDNTDADGFRLALVDAGCVPRGKRVLVLGAGGSARAVVWALCRSGVRSLVIANRTETRASELARLARRLRPRLPIETGPLDLAADERIAGSVDLVVNATSIGLDGRSRPPVALGAVDRGAIIFDLVYGRRPTPLLRAATRQGFAAVDGRGMLLHQARLAFRLWTGRAPPLDTMARALGIIGARRTSEN